MKSITKHFSACVILSVLLELTGYNAAAVMMLLAAFLIYVGMVIVDHAKAGK